jgi:hypothetical protein
LSISSLQPLKERLVQQAALLRACLAVGGLHIVGQGERHVEGVEHSLMAQAQLLYTLGRSDPLPADAPLLVAKQALADLVGIVGSQQLALLAVEAAELSFGV